MNKMNIEDVKISEAFMLHPPKAEKICTKRMEIVKNGGQVKPITVSSNGILTDGYATLLALKELGYSEVEYIGEIKSVMKVDYKHRETTYIFGRHLRGETENLKEYVWRLPDNKKDMEIAIGDIILANTKYGAKPVRVTRVEKMDTSPVSGKVRTVYRKVRN